MVLSISDPDAKYDFLIKASAEKCCQFTGL